MVRPKFRFFEAAVREPRTGASFTRPKIMESEF
jgi:hypothetical protein